MSRRRLLVVAPVPEPACSHVEGLRLALGDPSVGTIEAHVTLVPPVNIRDDALGDALGLIRALATHAPVTTQIGPVDTFAPTNPVLYLTVVEAVAVRLLRDDVFVPPLSRPLSHEFVPHVTVNRRADEVQIEHVPRTLRYREVVTFDRVALLEEHVDDDGRRWLPLADVWLGSAEVAGRGGLETVTSLSSTVAPDVAALVGDVRADVVVTAARGDRVLGAMAGSLDGTRLTVENLFVDDRERRTGIGRTLVHRMVRHARERDVTIDVSSSLPLEVTTFLRHLGPG